MLPLSEIRRLRNTVGEDWRSPVADVVAAEWGHPAGSTLFWRSSATHVFVVLDATATRREAFLRVVPANVGQRTDLETVTTLMNALSDAGLAVVRAVRSIGGAFVETIDTVVGAVHAMAVTPALGEQHDLADMAPGQVRAWGAALGRVHRDGSAATLGLQLPDGGGRLAGSLDSLIEIADPSAAAAGALRSTLRALDRDRDRYGLVHGDFELDNLAWAEGVPTAFDWDEAERSWFAADVAYAVRDLVPDPEVLDGRPLPQLDEFLAGYHAERPSAAIGRQDLLVFTGMNALRSVARMLPVLAEDPSAGQGLAVGFPSDGGRPKPLRDALEEYVQRQRSIAATAIGCLGCG